MQKRPRAMVPATAVSIGWWAAAGGRTAATSLASPCAPSLAGEALDLLLRPVECLRHFLALEQPNYHLRRDGLGVDLIGDVRRGGSKRDDRHLIALRGIVGERT